MLKNRFEGNCCVRMRWWTARWGWPTLLTLQRELEVNKVNQREVNCCSAGAVHLNLMKWVIKHGSLPSARGFYFAAGFQVFCFLFDFYISCLHTWCQEKNRFTSTVWVSWVIIDALKVQRQTHYMLWTHFYLKVILNVTSYCTVSQLTNLICTSEFAVCDFNGKRLCFKFCC